MSPASATSEPKVNVTGPIYAEPTLAVVGLSAAMAEIYAGWRVDDAFSTQRPSSFAQ
jgi:hypothetical protein